MSETANFRNKRLRRAVFTSVSLFTALAAGGIVFGVIEKIRDASDRAT